MQNVCHGVLRPEFSPPDFSLPVDDQSHCRRRLCSGANLRQRQRKVRPRLQVQLAKNISTCSERETLFFKPHERCRLRRLVSLHAGDAGSGFFTRWSADCFEVEYSNSQATRAMQAEAAGFIARGRRRLKFFYEVECRFF